MKCQVVQINKFKIKKKMLNAKIFQTKCKQTPATMTGDVCSHHCIVFLFRLTSFDLVFYPSQFGVKLVTK